MSERTEPGLPELSSLAWGATFMAGLIALALGVYPFVAYPAVKRLIQGPLTAVGLFVQPLYPAAFAGLVATSLFLALAGKRSQQQRHVFAFLALGFAMLGVVLLVAGIRSVAPVR